MHKFKTIKCFREWLVNIWELYQQTKHSGEGEIVDHLMKRIFFIFLFEDEQPNENDEHEKATSCTTVRLYCISCIFVEMYFSIPKECRELCGKNSKTHKQL